MKIPMQMGEVRYEDIQVNFSALTWSASSAGKYFTNVTMPSTLTGKTILSATISGWNSIRAAEIIQPFINNGSLALMSNVNNLSTNGHIEIRVTYKD